jgi:hypothetical protein
MGVIGQQIGTYGLGALGSYVGKKLGNESLGKKVGQSAGGIIGSELIPFKKGGMIKPKKGKTQKVLLHKGELVVPASMVKNVPKSLKKKIKKKGGRNM